MIYKKHNVTPTTHEFMYGIYLLASNRLMIFLAPKVMQCNLIVFINQNYLTKILTITNQLWQNNPCPPNL